MLSPREISHLPIKLAFAMALECEDVLRMHLMQLDESDTGMRQSPIAPQVGTTITQPRDLHPCFHKASVFQVLQQPVLLQAIELSCLLDHTTEDNDPFRPCSFHPPLDHPCRVCEAVVCKMYLIDLLGAYR